MFQFIRVEDIAYDRRPGMSKVVYLADTGEPRAKPSAIAGWTRLERSSTGGGPYMNGRIFKLTLGSNPLDGAALNRGTWESSGIVDASAAFGTGAFLVDVQAHGWDTEIAGGNDPPAIPKRENGQLLLLRAPGS